MCREEGVDPRLDFSQVFGIGRSLVAAARAAAVVIHGRGTPPEIAPAGELLAYVRGADDPAIERKCFGLPAVGARKGRNPAQHEYISHAEQQAHCQRYLH